MDSLIKYGLRVLAAVAGLASFIAGSADASPPEGTTTESETPVAPICNPDSETRGCWMPLQNPKGCHVWRNDAGLGPDYSASLEEDATCEDGRLNTTATVVYSYKEKPLWRYSGRYAAGRAEGHFVATRNWDTADESRLEGTYRDEQRVGLWKKPDHYRTAIAYAYGADLDRPAHGIPVVPLSNTDDCYLAPKGTRAIYNPHKVVFEGEFDCEGGMLSGTGTALLQPKGELLQGFDAIIRHEVGETWEEWSGTWAAGLPHGSFVIVRESSQTVFGRGYREETTYLNGKREGQRVTKDPRGRPLVVSTYVGHEATDFQLPSARPLPPADRGGGGAAPVTGAFGIGFGTADLKLLKSPEYRHCVDDVSYGLHLRGSGSCSLMGPSIVIGAVVGSEPPRPVAGADLYRVTVDARAGIVGLQARIKYESEEICKTERSRIEGILREKYGVCGQEFSPCNRNAHVDSSCSHTTEEWSLSVEYRVDADSLPGLGRPSAADF